MNNNIEEIRKWRTSDGEEFYSLDSAEFHNYKIRAAILANLKLDEGASVAEALRFAEWRGDIDPILEKVTKKTKLVIPHWQCRDTPCYQLREVFPSWRVNVWGDAGSWSGSYGNDMSIEDLARYAKHKDTIF